MIRHRRSATGWCLVLVLICTLIPKPTLANDGKPIRLPATAALDPIGTIYSLGTLVINGRLAHGEQMIWGGDFVSAEESSANAHLARVGTVGFSKGSSARLLTSIEGDPLHQGEATLDVVVAAGSLVISLQPNAFANVETGDCVVRSSNGSKFRVAVVEGETLVEVERGRVRKEPQQPRVRYIVQAAKLDSRNRPIPSSQKTYKAQTDNVVLIPVMVEVKPQPATGSARSLAPGILRVAYQAPATGKPAVGIDVEFCLLNPAIGSLGPNRTTPCTTITTNQFGGATAEFHAGPNKGVSRIRATIVDSRDDYWEGEIQVFKTSWFLRPRNIAILAAAAGGGIVCIYKCGPSGGPLRQVPPPQIP